MSEEHKPLPVAGYTGQSDEKIALANELKFAEERYLRILDKLADMRAGTSDSNVNALNLVPDQRMVALARTQFQGAAMWAVRSIFQPQRIKLPEDGR